MATSPAVASRVSFEAQKLRRYFDRITHCHVVIVAPHKHHQHGRHYSVHLELGVPHGPLVITHEPAGGSRRDASAHEPKRSRPDATHEDVYVVIRETFDIARRRLEALAQRLRRDMKAGPTLADLQALAEPMCPIAGNTARTATTA
jgi:hypothetical protein